MLDKCPCCDYRLAGLPPEHLCPECGFAYDPSVVILQLRKVKRGIWPLIGYLLCFGFYFWFVPIYRTRKPEDIVFVVVMAASILVQLWRALLSTNAAARFVLSRNGVLLLRTDGTRDHVPWSQVATIKQSFWSGALLILDSGRRVAQRCSAREFEGSSRKVRECIREIGRLKGIHDSTYE